MLLPPGRGVNAVPVDLKGAALSILVLFAVLVPLIEGPSRGWPWELVLTLGASVPLAWGTVHYLRRRQAAHRDALINPSLLKMTKVALGLLCILCVNPVIPGYLLVMSFVLQTGMGLTASQMANACAPIAFGAMAGITLIGPRLHRRIGVRVMMVGVCSTSISLCLAAWAVHGGELLYLPLAVAQFGMGLGMGMCGPQLSNATLQDVPMRDAGVAAGMLTAVQQIAGALGVALGGLVFFHSLNMDTAKTADYTNAYLQVLPLFLSLMAAAMFSATRLAKVMVK